MLCAATCFPAPHRGPPLPLARADHHCYFLNTCIGKRNYAFFFALALCSTLQMLAQVVFSVLGMTVWLERGNDNVTYYVLVALQALIAAVAGGATSSLLGFHVYLLWIGMGTYDWMWNKQDKLAEKARKANQARFEAEQQARLQRERERGGAADGAMPDGPAGRVAITIESHPVAAEGAAAAGVGGDSGGGLYAGFGAGASGDDSASDDDAVAATGPGGDAGVADVDEDEDEDAEGQEMIGVEYEGEAGGVYDDDAAGAYDESAAGGAYEDEDEDEAEHERVPRMPGASSAGSVGARESDSMRGSPREAARDEAQAASQAESPEAAESGGDAGAAAEAAGPASDADEEVAEDGAAEDEHEGCSDGGAASPPEAGEGDAARSAADECEAADTEGHAEPVSGSAGRVEEEQEEVQEEEEEDQDQDQDQEEDQEEEGEAAAAGSAAAEPAPEGEPVGESSDSTGRPGSAGELQPETTTPRGEQP